MTKSAEVRKMIVTALKNGKNDADTQEKLIQKVQAKFEYGRALARTYVINNWERAEAELKEMQKASKAKQGKKQGAKRATRKSTEEVPA